MGRGRILTVLGAVCVLAVAGQAWAYGLFTCYDPAGNEVCVVDTGTRTGFVPSDVCNATCPACAGRCSAARRFPERSGHWVDTWHGTPGMLLLVAHIVGPSLPKAWPGVQRAVIPWPPGGFPSRRFGQRPPCFWLASRLVAENALHRTKQALARIL